MSRIKLLTGIASVTWSYSPGEVVEIEDKEAAGWVKAGIAEFIEGGKDAIIETASLAPPEKAVVPSGMPKKTKNKTKKQKQKAKGQK